MAMREWTGAALPPSPWRLAGPTPTCCGGILISTIKHILRNWTSKSSAACAIFPSVFSHVKMARTSSTQSSNLAPEVLETS